MTIPAEAIEAAAKVIYGHAYGPEGWRDLPATPRQKFISDAKEILEAAAPHIIAGHFREINGKAVAHEIENSLQFNRKHPDAV